MAIGMRSAVLATLTTIGLTLAAAPATAATAAAPAATAEAAIIGGRAATDAYPFMAYLRKKGLPSHCGGSLIAANWIVTAAHCADLVVPGKTKARIGSPHRLKGGTLVGYERLVVHPGFKLPDMRKGVKRPLKNDIALVQLERKVDLAPIRIADDAGPAATPTRVIGWGVTCDDQPGCEKNTPRQLRELNTVLVPDKRCTMIDHASELCTGQRNGRAAMSCSGDSGGPQIRKIAGRWELIGATSRDGDDLNLRKDGSGICATNPKGGPGLGIWTDVTHHKPWIIKTITKHDPKAAAELTAM